MTNLPTAAQMMRSIADWIDSHEWSYESLSSGPVGEALSRQEIRDLLADDVTRRNIASEMRLAAVRMEERGE